jgi:hypothetical protein
LLIIKKDTPEILEKKQKIVNNCELLLKDVEERQEGNGGLAYDKNNKAVTLTDMRAKRNK